MIVVLFADESAIDALAYSKKVWKAMSYTLFASTSLLRFVIVNLRRISAKRTLRSLSLQSHLQKRYRIVSVPVACHTI